MEITDSDILDQAVLAEQIQSVSSLSNELATSMASLARLNRKAIVNIEPLVKQVGIIRIRERNLLNMQKEVESIREVASKVSLALKKLKSSNNAIDIIESLKNVELLQRDVSWFEGMKEEVEDAISDSEADLRNLAINGICEGDNGVNEIPIIIKFFSNRGIDITDELAKERSNIIRKEMMKNIPKLPIVNGDQNYLYNGGYEFEKYSVFVRKLHDREISIIQKSGIGERAYSRILRGIIESYIAELKKGMDFISVRKGAFISMFYELANGSSDVVLSMQRMGQNKIGSISTLEEMNKKCINESKGSFAWMLEDIRSRYEISGGGINNGGIANLGLDSTFMLNATRIKTFSTFKEQQIRFIEGLNQGSWLPSILPNGFIREKANAIDSAFLLGSFYADALEISFFSLGEKASKRIGSGVGNNINGSIEDENIGMMMLINWDSMYTLLNGSSTLKQVLGQRGLERCERLKKRAMDRAGSGWSQLTAKLMAASTKQGGQLSMSPKDTGKFLDDFFKSVEILCDRWNKADVPNFYKTQLASDIRKTLIPSYKVFCNAISGQNKLSKHLTMTPEELGNKINRSLS
ncbi:GTP-Rho binding exocyst subunit [Pichia kluyveri]|uniref:GTP-Rho binding exocyst subunit n=1 Tax=Pichia kluyveri TaxID=36015 RepID=A0AAV5R1G0_PICKL|nr:GTP-Rho binding exocyst subunit [Pichia kluyveri]